MYAYGPLPVKIYLSAVDFGSLTDFAVANGATGRSIVETLVKNFLEAQVSAGRVEKKQAGGTAIVQKPGGALDVEHFENVEQADAWCAEISADLKAWLPLREQDHPTGGVLRHEEHVAIQGNDRPCLWDGCKHADKTPCPVILTEVCVDCMEEREGTRDELLWGERLWPWPCRSMPGNP